MTIELRRLLRREVVILDGAMGTELARRGYSQGPPEAAVRDAPELVRAIHRDYAAAGARVLLADSFGAAPQRLSLHGIDDYGNLLRRAVELVREGASEAGREIVVSASLGPTGEFSYPLGRRLSGWFREQYRRAGDELLAAGVEAVFLETFGDLGELKQAVLALRELDAALFLTAQVTPGDDDRTLTGSPPEVVAAVLDDLNVDAVGLNCSTGPRGLLDPLRRLAAATRKPLVVEPNAGLPRTNAVGAVYDLPPEEFAHELEPLVEAGAVLVGGCCGTTPEHIAALTERFAGRKPVGRVVEAPVALAAPSRLVPLVPGTLIGEKLNPAGRPRLRRALRDGDLDYPLSLARRQVNAGALILDLNFGLESAVDPYYAERLLLELAHRLGVAVAVDVQDPGLAGHLLAAFPGRALYNSSRALPAELRTKAALTKRYGGILVVLALGETVPSTAAGRLELLDESSVLLDELGLPARRRLFDPVVTALGAGGDPRATLETIAGLTERGRRTVAGISNLSFGLPERRRLNAAFLTLALERGLTAAIVDPTDELLLGQRGAALRLLGTVELEPISAAPNGESKAVRLLIEGKAAGFRTLFDEALTEQPADPNRVVEELLRPSMTRIGELYAAGRLYLPQLILAAQSARPALEYLENLSTGAPPRGCLALASVKDDVHDIGKGIVAAVAAGAGYRVIDLGRDVATAEIVAACRKHQPLALGLSAMMTTTAPRITEVVTALRGAGLSTPVIVGGATLDADAAAALGADYYAGNAAGILAILAEIEAG